MEILQLGTVFETCDIHRYYTEINLKYRLRTDLNESQKESINRNQQRLLQPFMEFYQLLIENNLIEVMK